MSTPIATFSLVALDCPDPAELARFYGAILGWEVDGSDDGRWVQLKSSAGATIAFQRVKGFRPPEWPGQDHPQQAHLDFDVPDLDEGERRLLELGAVKHEHQPGKNNFRVYLDPAGHPFCLVRA